MAASPEEYEMEELPPADSLSLSKLQLSDLHAAGQVSSGAWRPTNIIVPRDTAVVKGGMDIVSLPSTVPTSYH